MRCVPFAFSRSENEEQIPPLVGSGGCDSWGLPPTTGLQIIGRSRVGLEQDLGKRAGRGFAQLDRNGERTIGPCSRFGHPRGH